LAEAFEDLRDGKARRFFDAVIKIDEAPGKLAREERTNGSFAGAHESGQAKNRVAGLWPARKRCCCHAVDARKTNRASECELYHCRRRVRLWRGLAPRCQKAHG